MRCVAGTPAVGEDCKADDAALGEVERKRLVGKRHLRPALVVPGLALLPADVVQEGSALEQETITGSQLVQGHEGARMWDVLKIRRGGKPSIVNLRAKG